MENEKINLNNISKRLNEITDQLVKLNDEDIECREQEKKINENIHLRQTRLSKSNEKQEKLDKAIDQIRKKYGEDSVRRARFLDGEMNHMAGGLNKEKSRYRQRREE